MGGQRSRRRARRLQRSRALESRDYRLFLGGHTISFGGSFVQVVAQSWLVLELTGGASALGIVAALQYGPAVVLAPWGGSLIDRSDPKRLFLATQIAATIVATILGVVTVLGMIELWMVFGSALVLGVSATLDGPIRHTLVYDLVGPENLVNAISLHMASMNVSRVVAPAVAAVTIATIGIGPCFLFNAATFGVMILCLLAIRVVKRTGTPTDAEAAERDFRSALRHVVHRRELLAILVLGAVYFGFAWQLDLILPMVARFTFDGGPGSLAILTSSFGFGAVIGGLAAARLAGDSDISLLSAAAALGVSLAIAGFSPTLWTMAFAVALVGASGIALASMASTRVQLGAPVHLRGRIMAMWAIAVTGTRPLGALLLAYAGDGYGPRAAFAIASFSVLAVAIPLWIWIGRPAIRVAQPDPYIDSANAIDMSPCRGKEQTGACS